MSNKKDDWATLTILQIQPHTVGFFYVSCEDSFDFLSLLSAGGAIGADVWATIIAIFL